MNAVVRANPRYVGGRIELMSQIGEGGCASVWLGRHRETNNLVAAKLVHARQDHDALAMRFQREAELSSQLVHRNLVRIFDYFREEDGQPVLLMEYLRGQTVEEVLQAKKALPLDATIAIAIAVMRGLQQAHDLGIIHRDIKPSNIFLAAEPDGVVIPKLLDFGIAKSKDIRAVSLTQDGEVLGTPAYMSPEQVRGGDVDASTDIFSLGAVIYEMLTGALAFAANTPSAALAAVLERSVKPHANIPAPLWPVLERALSKKKEDRQRSVEELRWEIEEACAHGEASGQEAIQALGIVVTKLPLLPALTPAPFHPTSTQQRIAQTATTMAAPPIDRASQTDETALITTSSSLHVLPKRRTPSWVAAGVATASIAMLGMFAWSRGGSVPIEATAATSVIHIDPEPAVPPPAPITQMAAPEAPAPSAAAASPSGSHAPVKPAKPRKAVGRNPGF